ncbi:MAG TPA: NAD(P)/FAD-dependent oxidoreductase [Thermoanaerobaculia bacterium]|jgi:phytoene dehydrogenase-like protein|nr:NAD(P)/FAD-dependent oxidoreductase [Thermoanaerobaculia bacterium]
MADVIVIGAGPNGLAAAAKLAGAGRKVVVLERADAPGGLSARREFHPGYAVPGLLHDESLVPRAVADKLGLAKHGLAFRKPPATYIAEANGPGILLSGETGEAADAIGQRSKHDAESYRGLRAFLGRITPLFAALLAEAPPSISPRSAGDFWQIARHGLAAFRINRKDLIELARVAPMCVADFLNEKFETPLLVEALAAPAVASTWSGPWSAGTMTSFLLRECAGGETLAGGPPALISALLAACRAAGAEIRTGAEVARIRLDRGKAVGVTLASGETIDAPVVLSSADPKRTMLKLLAPGTLPLKIEEELHRLRSRGSAAKVHLALSGPLEIGGGGHEAIRIGGGHVDDLERAFDAIKYRRFSERPHLEIRVPTVASPSLAPAGHHVVSILASFAPYTLDGGWTDEAREQLGDAVLAVLEKHAPGVRSRLVAKEILTPADLETSFALTGGQLHHGELALDQLLMMRPVPSAPRYQTTVPGLFLGGSGSHPGGGVRPTAGLLAAEAVLAG